MDRSDSLLTTTDDNTDDDAFRLGLLKLPLKESLEIPPNGVDLELNGDGGGDQPVGPKLGNKLGITLFALRRPS
ncbi:unnamed protein product [Schistosoma margrebowiei]|uniref:Uncharacterized protein n=1 Tax=Schistosoma margrebowiei TaxID=48269 RepID=A0A183N9Z9_9TREM|nr:unnamed protein product [Schistosoma margrebowiei]